MIKSCSRRVVVLRDIQSNIIEEAILVLKTGDSIDEKDIVNKNKIEKKRDFLIIKEAETIINSFVNDSKDFSNRTGHIKKLSKRWYVDLFINTCLIVGISIFIYLICKIL